LQPEFQFQVIVEVDKLVKVEFVILRVRWKMRIESDKIDETRSGTSMAIPSLVLVD
jgi:hypothetical protein